MQVKTQKLNAFRQEAILQEAIVGEKARRQKGKVDKKPNIRHFYKYGMLPWQTVRQRGYPLFLNRRSLGEFPRFGELEIGRGDVACRLRFANARS